MKELPILFKGPMVQAILDGRKTQTRRIVKIKPNSLLDYELVFDGKDAPSYCPYGSIGDRLWVRETFWVRQWGNTFNGIGIDYKAGGEPKHLTKRPAKVGRMCCNRPSIHMPRWASRITLEITGVRVERLNDISEADARAEGAGTLPNPCGYADTSHFACCKDYPHSAKERFQNLWCKINGADSWEANPWVFVIEFRVL